MRCGLYHPRTLLRQSSARPTPLRLSLPTRKDDPPWLYDRGARARSPISGLVYDSTLHRIKYDSHHVIFRCFERSYLLIGFTSPSYHWSRTLWTWCRYLDIPGRAQSHGLRGSSSTTRSRCWFANHTQWNTTTPPLGPLQCSITPGCCSFNVFHSSIRWQNFGSTVQLSR